MPGRTNKRKPPRGLVVNHDDLAALAGQPNQANNSLQAIDTEIVSLKRQVRYDKRVDTFLKKKIKKKLLKRHVFQCPTVRSVFIK